MKFVIVLLRFLNIKKENPANAFQILHKASKLAKDASSLPKNMAIFKIRNGESGNGNGERGTGNL